MPKPCDCCQAVDGGCPPESSLMLHRWIGNLVIPNNLKEIHLAAFKLRFTHLGVTTTTSLLSKNATYSEIQTALTSLANVGSGIVVTGGPLPNKIFITFSSPSTTNLNVGILEVLDESGDQSEAYLANVETEGSLSTNEVQSISPLPSKWTQLNLDRYLDTTWMWRVVILGTGDIPDLTPLCLAQHRRQFRLWTAPITDRPQSTYFKITLGNLKWPDAFSTQHGNLASGSYTLSLTTNSTTTTTAPIAWNATPTDVQNALNLLSNASRAGTIQVTGDPLDYNKHLAVAFISPLDNVSLSGTSNLVGTVPPIVVTTQQNGSTIPPVDETQLVEIAWPADSGTFSISATVRGTTQTTSNLPHNVTPAGVTNALENLININSGEVLVASTVGRHHYVTFTNLLGNTNIAPMIGTSNLVNHPTLIIAQQYHSDVSEFRNEFSPLNVGTTWKHYLRNAYGHTSEDPDVPGNRAIHGVNKTYTENPGLNPNTSVFQDLECGKGVIVWPGGCTGNSPIVQWGVSGIEPITYEAQAFWNRETGELHIETDKPFEFGLEILCTPCHFASNYNLWGIAEQSVNRLTSIRDSSEPNIYEPTGSSSCGDPLACRTWEEIYDNVPHIYRQKFGPDGYDGHLINEEFFIEGAMQTRKPVCKPAVVLLGDGYWLENNYSRSFPQYECSDIAGFKKLCPQKPRREYSVEHPVSDIERLKIVYGTDFSYWGGWIDPESLTLPKIRCLFDKYDLSDIEVLFLGGLSVGRCPQTGPFPGTSGGYSAGNWIEDKLGDEFFEGSQTWFEVLDKDFEEGALEPLKRWLDLGGKILVPDGGAFPTKFYTTLGISCTVDPLNVYPLKEGQSPRTINSNTLNGSWWTTPAWGPEEPIWTDQQYSELFFPACYVEPVAHPFTTNIPSGVTTSGTANLVTHGLDAVIGTSLAGYPLASSSDPEPLHYLPLARPSRGLLNISQKYPTSYDHTGSGFTEHYFNTTQKPAAGLLAYTTAISHITLSSNAVVIGRVKGVLPIAPWFNPATNEYITTDIDYPGIVVEPWKCSFRLSFSYNGSTEITNSLPYNANAATIKTALESLPNIGMGLSVVGGPLPGSVDITFSTALTTAVDVPQLVVLDMDKMKVDTLVQGTGTNDEVQRIHGGNVPSRVVVSAICELIEPSLWGANWGDVIDHGPLAGPNTHTSQNDGDGSIFDDGVVIMYQDVFGRCQSIPVPYYSKDGYQWGLGLSSIASPIFLRNLLEFREDF